MANSHEYRRRVVAEKAELDGRIAKLGMFIAGERFIFLDDAEKDRLRRQKGYMDGYSRVLYERIVEWQC